nr:MAG TPA: hypothetical protein [Bacteriophage sp.]DAR50194.1 MAG TPA: hypothetical protein [Caudoviricetes sp.]DAW70887.1 MAG TPA: hypothetical protein [Caudoviricetes sp.]
MPTFSYFYIFLVIDYAKITQNFVRLRQFKSVR